MSASPFTAETDFSEINCHFADRPLDDLLSWSLATFGSRAALVTSFGPTGMVVLDHLAKLSPGVKVITIDTDFLFEETYTLRERVQRRRRRRRRRQRRSRRRRRRLGIRDRLPRKKRDE